MSIVAPRGFTASGVACGIKDGRRDLAIIVAEELAAAAGVFTRNQAAAAPVLLSAEYLAGEPSARAVVINSGCANAATGDLGMKNAIRMSEVLASAIGAAPSDVLVCSTGTIGPQLPMDAVLSGIASAVAAADDEAASGTAAAQAIMTTDSVTKESVHRGDGWTVGGMAKGAGMVRPDMATMLAFVTTDADIGPEQLRASLVRAVDESFHSLNIDGCESTNDTVLALASGASGVVPDADEFDAAMVAVCRDLATQMARDAEGASRMVTIDVSGAASDAAARSLGRTVADSALVRSSFYGGDVNWGRILGALGASELPIDPGAITVRYHDVVVFDHGMGASFDEDSLLAQCEEGDLIIDIVVGTGPGSASIITTDLTPEYVVFNGERS